MSTGAFVNAAPGAGARSTFEESDRWMPEVRHSSISAISPVILFALGLEAPGVDQVPVVVHLGLLERGHEHLAPCLVSGETIAARLHRSGDSRITHDLGHHLAHELVCLDRRGLFTIEGVVGV